MRSTRRPSLNVLRLFLAAFCAVFSLVGGAPPARAAGLLIPTDTLVTPLAIRSHRVEVQIHERVAETRVVQVFHNHTDRVLEATYIFPIPAGAAVSGFAMTVNGVLQQGQLLEAAEARSIYEGIVARMQDPGLVEYMGGNLFRARVFPIPARGDQTVEIRFTQTLDYQSSTLHYRYPLRTTGPQASTMEDFTLRANIASRTAIRAVYSPTHRIDTTRQGEHSATVGFEVGRAALDHDFDLYYTVADADVGLSVLTHHPQNEDGYFLMMLAPRSEVTDHEIIGKDILFVVDTSGSMAGEKINHARQALRAWVERLNPDDTFNIIRFSTDVEQLSETSLSASPENRARAQRFIASLDASGGTAIGPALTQALAIPTRRGSPRIIVFLTDGMPTVGDTDTSHIIRSASERNGTAPSATPPSPGGNAQIFAFGLGDDVNTTFLDLLAQQNRGGADYAGSGAEMSSLLSSFYNKIAFPVLADLRLALRGADAYDIYPRDLGTLYRGGQLVVTGRYRTPGAVTVSLSATVANSPQPRAFEWPVTLPPRDESNSFIQRVWATRKVGYLLDEIRLRGENPELRDSVVQLARRFGIVTPYTSYLVTETPVAPAQPAPDLVVGAREPAGAPISLRRPSTPVVNTPPASAPTVVATATRSAPRRAMEADESVASTADYGAFQTLRGSGLSANAQMPQARPTPTPSQPADPSHRANLGAQGRGGFAVAPPPAVGMNPPAMAPPATLPVVLAPAPVDARGEAGRRIANNLRGLRDAERVTVNAGSTRFVSNRSMVSTNNTWEEQGLTLGTSRVLRLRSMGRAYFTLLRLRPELRELLSLGASVRFRFDASRVIDVSATNTDVSDADVEAFLR